LGLSDPMGQLAFSAGPLCFEEKAPSLRLHIPHASASRFSDASPGGTKNMAVASLGLAVACQLRRQVRRRARWLRQDSTGGKHGSGSTWRGQTVERYKGLDPKRLLNKMREAGVGMQRLPQPEDPTAAGALVDAKDAFALVLDSRRSVLQKGGPGLKPSLARARDYRLPLLVKYHKPEGMSTSMQPRHRRKMKQNEQDLRGVMLEAGDKWELDLYHPVMQLADELSGLILWSRSSLLTKELTDPDKGLMYVYEFQTYGLVNAEELRETLSAGVRLGIDGFAEPTYYAYVLEVTYDPDAPLQDPRSNVVLQTADQRSLRSIMRTLGHQVANVKLLQIGEISLADISVNQLAAATEDEEVWACDLASLKAEAYPEGRLPTSTEIVR